jgi:glucan phosphoethanolaminetransferase (alkaline phosphatase superfamily)
LQQPYTSIADEICLGTNHPTWLMIIRFIEEAQKLFWMTLFIVWLRLPDKYGITAIIWIMPCGIYPAVMFKTIASYIFIQKNIIKVKVAWWQSFGAPFLSGAIMLLIGFLGKITVFDYFVRKDLVLLGAALEILVLFSAIVLYFFLTVFLGGWDNENLAMFKKAAKMSGPSKIFVKPLYKTIEYAAKHSKWHNKFSIPSEEPEKEARELLIMKHSHDLKPIK